MNEPSIHIGTSGWNYNHWKENFYPADLPQNQWLKFYVQRFHTVEINNTFYRLPDEKTLEKWREQVPDHFIFAVKASRYITHMKKLKDPVQSVSTFFDRISILANKLGPVLFQLPPKWRANPQRLVDFLQILPGDFRYVFEFRNSDWWINQVYDILSDYRAAFCIFDLGGNLSPKKIMTDFVYIRLHGPEGPYMGKYENNTLNEWARALLSWREQGKSVYCYFDNDQAGYAADNADKLITMI